MKQIKHCVILIICLFMASVLFSGNVEPEKINLEDKILKEGKFFSFGSRGFGLHDKGAGTFKIFDWSFKLLNEVKISTGEGPGQLRHSVGCAWWTTDGHIILNGTNEYLLNKYDSAGKFIRAYRSDLRPLYIKVLNGKLYVVSRHIEMNSNKESFLQIIDMEDGKILKSSKFKEIPETGAPDVGFSTLHYNAYIDDKGVTNILYGASARIYRFTADGILINRIDLPHKDKQLTKRYGDNVSVKWYKLYKGLIPSGDNMVSCFVEYDYKKKGKDNCRIMQINSDGSVTVGRIHYGYFTMIGGNENKVFIFNRDDYFALPLTIGNL